MSTTTGGSAPKHFNVYLFNSIPHASQGVTERFIMKRKIPLVSKVWGLSSNCHCYWSTGFSVDVDVGLTGMAYPFLNLIHCTYNWELFKGYRVTWWPSQTEVPVKHPVNGSKCSDYEASVKTAFRCMNCKSSAEASCFYIWSRNNGNVPFGSNIIRPCIIAIGRDLFISCI